MFKQLKFGGFLYFSSTSGGVLGNIRGYCCVTKSMGKLKLNILFKRRMVLVAAMVTSVCFTLWSRPGDVLQNRPYADLKLLHFGFSVGVNVQDLEFTHNGFVGPRGETWGVEVPSFSPGISANVLADLRLHPHFNLRVSPGMFFGSKEVVMLSSQGEKLRQDIKSAYVVVPFDLKMSGERIGNTRPFAVTGVMATFDVGKKRSELLQFNTSDLYYTVGFGCDFYHPFFKFVPEIKFCFGLTDILRHERPDLKDNPDMMKITQSLGRVQSNMVLINFYFE